MFLISAIVVGLIVVAGGIRNLKEIDGKNAHEKLYKHKKPKSERGNK